MILLKTFTLFAFSFTNVLSFLDLYADDDDDYDDNYT